MKHKKSKGYAATVAIYEVEKAKLKAMNLEPEEYQKQLRELAKRLGV